MAASKRATAAAEARKAAALEKETMRLRDAEASQRLEEEKRERALAAARAAEARKVRDVEEATVKALEAEAEAEVQRVALVEREIAAARAVQGRADNVSVLTSSSDT
jgi:hypothetical protein